MFLPSRNVEQEKRDKQRYFNRIEGWCLDMMPENLRADCLVSVQEVQCGDPNCSPVDTSIALLFNRGGEGLVNLPMEAKDVTFDDLDCLFPPDEILEKWHRGEAAQWNPYAEAEYWPGPRLRFEVGTQVVCKVGRNAWDWEPGQITELWYREEKWPAESFAPYKVRLHDGRQIFAPKDEDRVVRLNPNYCHFIRKN